METEKKEKRAKVSQTIRIKFQKLLHFFSRWFFWMMIFLSFFYAALIWKKYIVNAEWSEEKKKAYISEQSVLPFNEEKYKKALEIKNSRQEKLGKGEKFSGRDIFFPEGF
jgi:flagellar biosynthesis/type III secretory pathway M-ring protein FliF/YscJ